jgi:hypothetical protein
VADGLLPDDRWSGAWNDDTQQFRVVGWRFGPAGAAVVDLSPGIRLALDAARPQQLTELLVDAPGSRIDGPDRALLEELIGDDVMQRLLATATTPRGLHPLTDDVHYDIDRRFNAKQPSPFAVLAGYVLAADAADDASLSGPASALAGAEAAAFALELSDLRLVEHAVAHALARRHLDTLVTLDLEDVVGVIGRSERTVPLLRRVVALLDPDDPITEPAGDLVHRTISRTMARQGMMQLAEEGVPEAIAFFARESGKAETDDDDAPPFVAAAVAAPASAPMHRAERADRADLAGSGLAQEPVAVDSVDHVIAWLSERGTHLHVLARAASAGEGNVWVRAFDRSRRLLLGTSPLHADAGQSTALVLIPPGYRSHDLVVDLTTTPAQPRPSAERVAFARAIDAGRRAARFDRLRRRPDAHAAWLDCATAWRDAGDDQRAHLADEYAHGRATRGTAEPRALPIEPLVIDDVLEPPTFTR